MLYCYANSRSWNVQMPWVKGRSGNAAGPRRGRTQFKKPLSEWKPTIVNEGDSIDCLDYLQAVIDSPATPQRDKLQAAAILAPFQHVKPTGKYLTVVKL
jgi:hypothetical protein